MTSPRENVSLLKEAYRQWNDSKAGSIDHWLELLADEIDFRSLAQGGGNLEFSCDRHSRDEVGSYFRDMCSTWEMIHYTPDEFIAEGERVAVLGVCAWKHRATGRSFSTPKADFFRFRDGKIISFREFFDTAGAFAAAKPEG